MEGQPLRFARPSSAYASFSRHRYRQRTPWTNAARPSSARKDANATSPSESASSSCCDNFCTTESSTQSSRVPERLIFASALVSSGVVEAKGSSRAVLRVLMMRACKNPLCDAREAKADLAADAV
eukprot:scaffold2739_cov257-Pinguiococcus_pyrenoidosus.AAC.9